MSKALWRANIQPRASNDEPPLLTTPGAERVEGQPSAGVHPSIAGDKVFVCTGLRQQGRCTLQTQTASCWGTSSRVAFCWLVRGGGLVHGLAEKRVTRRSTWDNCIDTLILHLALHRAEVVGDCGTIDLSEAFVDATFASAKKGALRSIAPCARSTTSMD